MQFTFILLPSASSVHNTQPAHKLTTASCTPYVFNLSASHRRLLSKQCSLLYVHNAQLLTRLCPLPCLHHCSKSLSLRYQQIFGTIILAKFSSSSWVLLMRRPIRQMLSVSANQVPRLAIKSAQLASVQNELLATTECLESSFFPPLPKISLSRWNLTPVGLSGR